MAVHPVILCGGAGTRLWPASRATAPKQFLGLIGERSSFQETALRVAGLEDVAEPIVVAGIDHRRLVGEQLAAIGVQASVLLEPEARDSAAAMAAAAAWITHLDPLGVAVFMAADHHIPDASAFREAAQRAVAAARHDWIVTLGVKPSFPSPAYGYIQPGRALKGGPDVFEVARFIEKPDAATAAGYIEAGYLWNSGNFIVGAQQLLDELDRYEPDVAAAARGAVEEPIILAPGVWRLGDRFLGAPRISIDYAVIEKTERVAVAPVTFDWSDLGAWDAIWSASPKDDAGNAAPPSVRLVETENCLVRAPRTMSVALIGARNLAVIVESDAVLVCDLNQSQSVKTVAAALAPVLSPSQIQAAIPVEARLVAHRDRFHTWLFASALPLWWTLGADHSRGGFHEALDLTGRASGSSRRARVQARQAHVFAQAGAMGWPGPWRAAAEHAWNGFETNYRRPDGLYRTLVAADGRSLDETPWLYDQAFGLLAMASLRAVMPERSDLVHNAEMLLEAITAEMGHDEGFREAGDRPYVSNPHMHLLEAALAWIDIGGGDRWRNLASEIVDLALHRFIDPDTGALREIFDENWRAIDNRAGQAVEPGHQFEWAWLLDRWATISSDERVRRAALRLAEIGAKDFDPDRSVVIDAMDDTLRPIQITARLWPQTERLKAAARLALAADGGARTAWLEVAASASSGLWTYLDLTPAGLWRDRQNPDGGFVPGPSPASSLYHIIGAVSALESLSAPIRPDTAPTAKAPPGGLRDCGSSGAGVSVPVADSRP